MKNVTQIGLLLFSFFYCATTYAQLEAFQIEGEGWAKGNLVEIGVNAKGVFGANHINKPSGFHTNREDGSNGIFGFIANPANDGWIDYDGGFFTPGAPEEGFSIEINGENFSNNNVDSLFEIPGSIVDINVVNSDCTEDIAKILWEGNIDGLIVKRNYSVTQNGLFIKMETTLENLSTVTKEEVFFMHNVDPDNNVTINGRFDTDMKLISQSNANPNHISLVTASQTPTGIPEDMDGSKISFYANEPSARVTFGGFSNRSASNVWNGNFGLVNTQGSTLTGVDKAISIAFNVGNIEPSESVSFTYYYVLEEIDQTFNPVVINTSHEHPTTCNGSDGKIKISGLEANKSYTISYNNDGDLVSDLEHSSNADGDLEIDNLNAGNYNDLILNLDGCLTRISASFWLNDPEAPIYNLEKTDITDCETVNGQIKITGLEASTDYSYEFQYNGNPIGPINETANTAGEIIISNLERGTYQNFNIKKYNNCATFSAHILEIEAPEGPELNAIPEQFFCDNDDDYITTINLSDLDVITLGAGDPSQFIISYHSSEMDVITNTALPILNYTTSGLESYTLFVKKTSLNDYCYSYLPFVITIKKPITFSLNSETICVNSNGTTNFEFELPIITTGLSESQYTFEWFYEDDYIPGEDLNHLIANSSGNYSVIVTDIVTGCTITESTTITPSGPPSTFEVEITSPPFSGNHTVEVVAVGFGDYEYSMDNGTYQSSPVFSQISSGLHIFSVRDVNGCGFSKIEKTLMDYLHHFSPNNDGHHDYWKINTSNLDQPEIYIFDRKGKLLKQLDPKSIGWDGSYRNAQLPTDDYWFKVLYNDAENNKQEFTANFTLKH